MATPAKQFDKHMKMRKFYATLLVSVLILLFGAGCSPANRHSKATSITIAQFGDFFLYLPIYVAIDQHFFSDNGLQVTLVNTGGDEKTWAAVLSNNAQFGVADPTFVAISAQRGQGGKVVASIVNGVPFWGVAYSQRVPVISNPQDLNHFRIGTFPSPSTAYTLQARMFKEGGLDPSIRQAAPGTLLTLLQDNQVDIALELEPNVSTAIKRGGRVVYSLAQRYGDFAMTGLTTTNEYIFHNPDIIQAVVDAIQKAERLIRMHPSLALEVARTRFPEIDADVARQALQRSVQENIIPATPVLSPEAWRKAIALRVDAHDVETPGSMQSFVDNKFAQTAASKR